MLAPNQPGNGSFIREVMLLAVFASCVAFFGGLGIMSVIAAPTQATSVNAAETESTYVVHYRELKNLGGGLYLCEVWTQYSVDATIIKLTASEKAKLQRAH